MNPQDLNQKFMLVGRVSLSPVKIIHSRTAYGVFDVLGEIGGV